MSMLPPHLLTNHRRTGRSRFALSFQSHGRILPPARCRRTVFADEGYLQDEIGLEQITECSHLRIPQVPEERGWTSILPLEKHPSKPSKPSKPFKPFKPFEPFISAVVLAAASCTAGYILP